jgi:hypothetical protein
MQWILEGLPWVHVNSGFYMDIFWFMKRRSTYMDNSFGGNGHMDMRNTLLESCDRDKFNGSTHESYVFELEETLVKYWFFMNYEWKSIYLDEHRIFMAEDVKEIILDYSTMAPYDTIGI